MIEGAALTHSIRRLFRQLYTCGANQGRERERETKLRNYCSEVSDAFPYHSDTMTDGRMVGGHVGHSAGQRTREYFVATVRACVCIYTFP